MKIRKELLIFLGILLSFPIFIDAQSYNMTFQGRRTVSGCGIIVYDNGGANGNYAANSRDTITITSNNPSRPYVQVRIQTGSEIHNSDTVFFYNAGTANPQYGVLMGNLNVPWWNSSNNIIIGDWTFRANSMNPDNGAVTIVLKSNGSVQASGLVIEVTCHEACQPINATFDRINCDPPLVYDPADGYYYMNLCPDYVATLAVSSSADVYIDNNHMYNQSHATSTFTWHVGDLTFTGIGDSVYSSTFPAGRGQDVRLEIKDWKNCPSSNIDYIRIRVSDNPIRHIAPIPDVCSGQIIPGIIVGYDSTSMITLDTISNTQTSSLTFDSLMHLPDGPRCEDYGIPRCYDATVFFTDFPLGATLTSPNDLISVCFTMEHTYLGDITIDLICPNGQSVRMESQNGGGVFLGDANDYDSGTQVCFGDPANCGTGWNYCFSENTTQGFSYGPGNGYLYEGNTVPTSQRYAIDSTNRILGTNYYRPVNSFTGLIGCPLNGAWSFQVCDQWGVDDGWIWEWSLNLDPSLMPQPWDYTITVDQVQWTGDNIIPDDDYTAHIDASVAGNYNYTFTVIDNYGCVYDSTFTLTVVQLPTPNLGDDIGICGGSSTTLNPNYTANNTSYLWNTGATSNTIVVNTAGTYDITVTTTNNQGTLSCVGYDTVVVEYLPQPVANFTSNKTEGCQPLTFTLTDLSTPSLTYNYLWIILNAHNDTVQTSTQRNPTITLTESGIYTVTLYVISEDGCWHDTTFVNYIEVFPQPDANFTVNYSNGLVAPVPDEPTVIAATTEGTPVEFINTSHFDPNDQLTWQWDFGDNGNSTAHTPEPHPYEIWGDYEVTLTVTSENNCTSSITYIVNVEAPLEFPNVLTPNGDGHNDVFIVKNLNPNFPNVFSVYDRWGKKVYEKKNYTTYMKNNVVYNADEGFNPEKLSDGVYFFTFKYESYVKVTEYHSSLTLIR